MTGVLPSVENSATASRVWRVLAVGASRVARGGGQGRFGERSDGDSGVAEIPQEMPAESPAGAL